MEQPDTDLAQEDARQRPGVRSPRWQRMPVRWRRAATPAGVQAWPQLLVDGARRFEHLPAADEPAVGLRVERVEGVDQRLTLAVEHLARDHRMAGRSAHHAVRIVLQPPRRRRQRPIRPRRQPHHRSLHRRPPPIALTSGRPVPDPAEPWVTLSTGCDTVRPAARRPPADERQATLSPPATTARTLPHPHPLGPEILRRFSGPRECRTRVGGGVVAGSRGKEQEGRAAIERHPAPGSSQAPASGDERSARR
jgi:hypothetical protein